MDFIIFYFWLARQVATQIDTQTTLALIIPPDKALTLWYCMHNPAMMAEWQMVRHFAYNLAQRQPNESSGVHNNEVVSNWSTLH